MSEADARRNNLLKEKVVVLEFKINKLGISGRAYYEASQIKLRRNRYLIRSARTKNMLLHSALLLMEQKELASRKEASNLGGMRKQASDLREKFDQQRRIAIAKQLELAKQITDTRAAEIDCTDVLDPNTPSLIVIRWLDNRLETIFRRIKETQMLENQYESLLLPMRAERTLFTFQIENITNVIDLKNDQIGQLKMVEGDGVKSRDQARIELEEEGISKSIQNRIQIALRKIKKAMEVDSMREMYQQYMFQDKQIIYLEQIKAELIETLSKLRNEAPIPATHRRRSTSRLEQVGGLAEGVKATVRRMTVQVQRKNSYPLVLLVEGTKKLVEKIHEGTAKLDTMEASVVPEKLVLAETESKLVFLLKALDRKMKFLEDLEKKQKAELAQLEEAKSEAASSSGE
ncbi:hypothetical protein M758_12G003800 [Ceratodon purpureus]|uniref:Uncharacterized protein n=1 Tax=Ceratodon purpureus TaxID=3225 RepID=A0A8T0G491_CERPU|nr:hypothetical protein KC19_12G001600 [Ceratodon purpureus]KAG0597554.1 hypothetical protein M758_12G003800 [Ceratodon purpureus]